MPIRITGLKELRAELRVTPGATTREIKVALREGADEVAARARALAPKKTGKMASTGKAFSTTVSAGVKFRHPGAAVQEFATTYLRQPPGSGGHGSRALKRHIKAGYISTAQSGLVEVHMVNVSAPGPSGGRFAYKAVDELAPALMETTFATLVEILRLHGWFEGG